MLDHPRSAIVGISSVLKFALDPIYSFGDIAIFIFCLFFLKLPIHAHFRGLLGAYFPQDRTGQSKKSHGGNISPIWVEAPTAPIETKICMVGHLADIITYAKFHRGSNFPFSY